MSKDEGYGSSKDGDLIFDGMHEYLITTLQHLEEPVTAYWHYYDENQDIRETYSATFKHIYWLNAGFDVEANDIIFRNQSILATAGWFALYANRTLDFTEGGAIVSSSAVHEALIFPASSHTVFSKRIVALQEERDQLAKEKEHLLFLLRPFMKELPDGAILASCSGEVYER